MTGAHREYLFIDGENLKKALRRVAPWFGGSVDLRHQRIPLAIGSRPWKIFYYDCIDDAERDGETKEETAARVAGEEASLHSIDEIDRWHVRRGYLVGKRKRGERRQKEVDIMLAVDALRFAAQGIMTQAVLLSGDRDFRPLVKGLVDSGIHVRVAADERSFAKELARAADSFTALRLENYHNMVSPEQHRLYPPPQGTGNLPANVSRVCHGKTERLEVEVVTRNSPPEFYLRECGSNDGWRGNSPDRLRLFAELHYGHVDWT